MQPIRLFIPIICYNHMCHSAFMFSLMKLILALKDKGIDVSIFPIGFDSLVCRARNAAIAHFMSKNYTHILFLDTDIEFQPEDIFKMLNAKEKVVGGAYAQKWLNMNKIKTVFSRENVPVNPMLLCTNHSVHIEPFGNNTEDKLEVQYLTSGCMLIEKSVIDIMTRAYPERRYTNDIDGYAGADKDMFYNFFSVEINNETNRYESEDYSFCRLWRERGGHVYVIPDISLTHYGWFGYQTNLKTQLEDENYFKK